MTNLRSSGLTARSFMKKSVFSHVKISKTFSNKERNLMLGLVYNNE